MNGKFLSIYFGVFVVWSGPFQTVSAQPGARNTVPETVASCYRNSTAYNRYTRQPMHISNLISIIRKIERKEPQWDMRRIARILVNRYMFDGIQFDGNARIDLQYIPTSNEALKTTIIKELIPAQIDEILPQGVLDNDELCALHWMLSHSMNSTVRDEELGIYPNGYNSYNNPGSGSSYNNPGSGGYNSGSGYNQGSGYNNQGSGGYNNPGSGSGYNYNSNNNGYNSESGNMKRWRRSADQDNENHDDFWDENHEENDHSEEEQVAPQSPAELLKPDEGSAEHHVSAEEDHHENESDDDKIPPAVQGRSASALAVPTDMELSDDSQSKSARQVSQLEPGKTRRPVETGVVYTNWGSVSAGRLIAGIAAALQPMTTPVGGSGSPYPNPGFYGSGSNSGGGAGQPGFSGNYPGFGGGGSPPFGSNPLPDSNNPFNSGSNANYNYQGGRQRVRRQVPGISFQPLQNLHAATLAGDVGQAAIRNGKYPVSSVAPPRGTWNDTICPREYILEPYPYNNKEIYMDDAALTHMTEAEIRGGMDGLILGSHIQRWDNAGIKLSELLEMFYSETGISGEPQYRACNRGSLFSGSTDMNTIHEQAKSFAYLYNEKSQVFDIETVKRDPNVLLQPVIEVYQKMSGVTGNIGSSDPPCQRRQSVSSSTVETDDNMKYTEIRNRFYVVLDHTATYDEIVAQKRFIGQLAHEVNVSPRGSRLGVVDGNSGQILINPNLTDTAPILACNVLALPTQLKTQDMVRVINNLRTEFQKIRDEEMRINYESDLGIVVMFLVQGRKVDEGQKAQLHQMILDLSNQYGDVRVIFTSSKYQVNDFDGLALDPQSDFIRIQSIQNISDFADEFANEMRTKGHGRLSYTKCNTNLHNQDEEHKIPTTFFVTPDTIQYYKIAPDYFYSSKKLKLRFSSDNGKIRTCLSRDITLPSSRNGGDCRESTGNYVAPGSAQIDIEYEIDKPCGKHGNREECRPIYISFTPTTYPPAGQTGWDCSIEGCQSPNQVKVTFTHWDMRCNGSLRNLISLPLALGAFLVSLIMWQKSL